MGTGLGGYLIRRLLWAAIVLLVISFLVFATLRLAPGDPVDTLLGNRYDEETAARLRDKYGYDEPLVLQYFTYMGNLARGDLGVSTRHADFSVEEVVVPKVWVSARLGAMALIIVFALGIPAGIYAALARGTFLDPLVIGFWLLIDAIPVFVAIPIAQYVFALKLSAVGLGWEGLASPNIILPVLLMSLPGVAGVARFMRASVISIMGEDYIRTARAKGLSEWTVTTRHITRNALLPMITIIGLSLPGIVTGALFVERFFGIPGIASELFEAVLAPDYDVVLALVLFTSFLFVLANILVDVVYAAIDPRIRIDRERG